MSGPAIVMMLVAMAIIWGGLIAAILRLRAADRRQVRRDL